jgi:hypothetical protein
LKNLSGAVPSVLEAERELAAATSTGKGAVECPDSLEAGELRVRLRCV